MKTAPAGNPQQQAGTASPSDNEPPPASEADYGQGEPDAPAPQEAAKPKPIKLVTATGHAYKPANPADAAALLVEWIGKADGPQLDALTEANGDVILALPANMRGAVESAMQARAVALAAADDAPGEAAPPADAPKWDW